MFRQEIGLIRTRQRWLAEQRERLDAKLATATPEDRRFILGALSVKVMAQLDGTWELDLQVPREAPAPAANLQIVSSRPESERG